MKKTGIWILSITLMALLVYGSSCRKEQFESDPSSRLTFSTDTLMFDTLFTQLGGGPNPRSVNKRFTVHNPHAKTIKTSIHLGMGNISPFRINVDGLPVSHIEDYEIRPNDSIYVFVELSIDQNNQTNPLIVQDSVVFQTNGNVQDVKLVAWGQDAHYLVDSVLTGNVTWADQTKPYVIFNSVLVDENASLTIKEGVKVYSSVNSKLYVNGTLRIEGVKDNPVVLQGARLEQDYRNTPSQWYGIWLLTESRDNSIRYAEIKNGVIGVRVDYLQNGGGFKLDIQNTKILNMSAGGLIGYTTWIKATNVLSANCGQYTFLGELGGHYELTHCTFANYNTTFLRSKPAFGLSNADYTDTNGVVTKNPLYFDVANCIIWGSLKEELTFFLTGGGSLEKTTIRNSILKTEFVNDLNVNDNILNKDPYFKDYRELNFQLDTLSVAKDAAPVLNPPVLIDLLGELRDAQPDIGAFERKE